MKLAKEEQLNYWREHVNQASLHEQGLFGYCQEQKCASLFIAFMLIGFKISIVDVIVYVF